MSFEQRKCIRKDCERQTDIWPRSTRCRYCREWTASQEMLEREQEQERFLNGDENERKEIA